ncbi:PepSY domain-containing protein [Alphaproteobacteria bacterium]|nr:PepSY domain-containing protein [Alphaproteobacteria bacterium]
MIISAKTKTFLRLIHKYVGFIFSIFILILTLTGIMLLYPEPFKLNDTYVSNSFILKKYNMLSIEDVKKLGRSTEEIILIDKSLYYKNTFIEKFEQDVNNAFQNKKKDYLIIFLEKKIYFFFLNNTKGNVEVMDIKERSLDEEILRIGEDANKNLVLETRSNLYSILNTEVIKKNKKTEVNWIKNSNPNVEKAEAYLEVHQGKGVPLHRIITEMHNGKIMGSFLSYIFFLTSISLLFLIVSSFFFGINIKRSKK